MKKTVLFITLKKIMILHSQVFTAISKRLTLFLVLLAPFAAIAQVLIKQQPGVIAMATSVPAIECEFKVSDATAVNGKGATPSGEFGGWVNSVTISYMEPLFMFKSPLKGPIRLHWQVTKLPIANPSNNTDFKNVKNLLDSGSISINSTPNLLSKFHINLLKAANNDLNRTTSFHIRVIPLDASGTFIQAKTTRVLITYKKADNIQMTITPLPGTKIDNSPHPQVYSSTSLKQYLPPILNGDQYQFILTKTPPAGELKMVLDKMNIKTIGQKFRLTPQDYEKIKNDLSWSDQAKAGMQQLWAKLKDAYNWFDNKYNYVENAVVDKLAPVVGREYARTGINYFKSIYGLKPSYGNFDEAIGYGEKALNAYLNEDKEKSEAEKGLIKKYIGEFMTALKHEANGGNDPNQFYRQNPDFSERPAMVVLNISYNGVNNPPPGMKGGKQTVTIKVYSGKATDNSTLLSNGQNPVYPEVLLFEKTTEVPEALPGEQMAVPVFLDYSPLYKNDNFVWTRGYNAGKPGRIEINGSAMALEVMKVK